MTRTLVVGLALCVLAPLVGATEIDDQIRSTCRWIDSEEIFPTAVLRQIAASDGVSSECSTVLTCLLEARSGSRADKNDEPPESAPTDPASLCWRVTDIEQLPKEIIDRMAGHLDDAGKKTACGRFLICLSRSGLGAAEDRSWREEFARICSMTDIADTLSREELQALIDDSETLLAVLGDLSAPEAKVYIFRTKMCRDLFVYSLQVLESKTPVSR